MTDYFADLERDLHRAAARRARKRKIVRPVVAFASVAAAVAIVVAVAGPGEQEREVAGPAPTVAPAVDHCGQEIPKELRDRFEVFRRPADEAPPGVTTRLEQDLPGLGRPSRLWEPRLAFDRDGARIWLYPAQMGASCLRSDPAVCFVFVRGETSIPGCHRLPAGSTTAYEVVADEGAGKEYRTFIVEDGVTVDLDGRQGESASNISYFEGPVDARVTITGELRGAPGCRGRPETVATDPPYSLDALNAPGSAPGEDLWSKALLDSQAASAYVDHGRYLLSHEGIRIAAIPVTLCRAEEAAICLTAIPDFASEMSTVCANRAQIEAGEAVQTYGIDDQRLILAALVPDGTKAATYEGRKMTVDGNLAWIAGEIRVDGPPRVTHSNSPAAAGGVFVPDGGTQAGHDAP